MQISNNLQLMRFSHAFLRAKFPQDKIFVGSVTVSRDASPARDKIEISLFQSLDMVDIDVVTDPRISLAKDSVRHLSKAKNLKEDLEILHNAEEVESRILSFENF